MLGISYNDFWDMTPKELEPFIKAFSLKQDNIDLNMWVMGRYIQLAIGSCMDKKCKYPDKPLRQKVAVSKQDDIKSRFMYKMEQLNSRFEED